MSQVYGEQRSEYSGSYEPEQQQKVYPQVGWRLQGSAVWIFVTVLSSIGFGVSVAGIVGSAIVLKYANGVQMLLAGGLIGLISSIVALLMCIGIFVIGVVILAVRVRGGSRWGGRIF